ncbi:MAG: hypothetical protein A2W62_02780 [Alphaproteobacteria bacterium RIFCSPLOWO2_02_42_7]|nr:MAG: hypothetical protein A2W62_02780 [Alphaproteobacteria bacterium RIFCSPLOWO2_02_42_7]
MKCKKCFLGLISLLILTILGLFFIYKTSRAQEPAVIINEFLPNPEGKDSDSEWIELFNSSSESVDLSGWFLDDIEGGSKTYEIPLGTLIAPKSYLVFNIQDTKIQLNNTGGDSVRLLDPNKTVTYEISYADKANDNLAYALIEKNWQWTENLTPGSTNNTPTMSNDLVKQEETQTIETQDNTTPLPNTSETLPVKDTQAEITPKSTTKQVEKTPTNIQDPPNPKELSAFLSKNNSLYKSQLVIFTVAGVLSLAIGITVVLIKNKKRSS